MKASTPNRQPATPLSDWPSHYWPLPYGTSASSDSAPPPTPAPHATPDTHQPPHAQPRPRPDRYHRHSPRQTTRASCTTCPPTTHGRNIPAAQDHNLTWWRTLVINTAAPNSHLPTEPAMPDDNTATSDPAPISVLVAVGDTEQQDVQNDSTVPPTTPTRRPNTRRLIADALHDHPDATNTQLHTLLSGAVSIRTIQRHRAALTAHHQPTSSPRQRQPSPPQAPAPPGSSPPTTR